MNVKIVMLIQMIIQIFVITNVIFIKNKKLIIASMNVQLLINILLKIKENNAYKAVFHHIIIFKNTNAKQNVLENMLFHKLEIYVIINAYIKYNMLIQKNKIVVQMIVYLVGIQ